jgi:ABC-type phosphate transport system substrate-binding protein
MGTDPFMIRIGRARLLLMGLGLSLASHTATPDVIAVVSSKSAITTLSKTQLADIFLGRVSRFPNGARVVPIDQAEDSAAREEFYAKVADKSAAQMKAYWSAYWSKIIFTGRGQPPKEVANGAEMKRRLAQNPDAIGYIDEKLVDDTVRVVR